MPRPTTRSQRRGPVPGRLAGIWFLLLFVGHVAASRGAGQDLGAHRREVNRLFGQAISAANSTPQTRGVAGQLRALQARANAAFDQHEAMLRRGAPARLASRASPPARLRSPSSPPTLAPAPTLSRTGPSPLPPYAPPSAAITPLPGLAPLPPVPDMVTTRMETGMSASDDGGLVDSVLGSTEGVLDVEALLGTQPPKDEASDAVAQGGAGLSTGGEADELGIVSAEDDWLALLDEADSVVRETDALLAAARGDAALAGVAEWLDAASRSLHELRGALVPPAGFDNAPSRLQANLPDLYGIHAWLVAGGYAGHSVFQSFRVVSESGASDHGVEQTLLGPLARPRDADSRPVVSRNGVATAWNDAGVVDLRDAKSLVPVMPPMPPGVASVAAPNAPPASRPQPAAAAGTGMQNRRPPSETRDGEPGVPPAAPVWSDRLTPAERETIGFMGEVLSAGIDAGMGMDDAWDLLDDTLARGHGALPAFGHLVGTLGAVLDADAFLRADNEGRVTMAASEGYGALAGAVPTAGFTAAIGTAFYGVVVRGVARNLQGSLDAFTDEFGMSRISFFQDDATAAQRVVGNVLGVRGWFEPGR